LRTPLTGSGVPMVPLDLWLSFRSCGSLRELSLCSAIRLLDQFVHHFRMDYLASRLRDFLCHKQSVITKQPNAVANTQYLDEFPEFDAFPAEIYLYRILR
jgi:hypothetical protein